MLAGPGEKYYHPVQSFRWTLLRNRSLISVGGWDTRGIPSTGAIPALTRIRWDPVHRPPPKERLQVFYIIHSRHLPVAAALGYLGPSPLWS